MQSERLGPPSAAERTNAESRRSERMDFEAKSFSSNFVSSGISDVQYSERFQVKPPGTCVLAISPPQPLLSFGTPYDLHLTLVKSYVDNPLRNSRGGRAIAMSASGR